MLDNGSIGVAMSEISTPACQFTVPVGIPEGKVGSIWAVAIFSSLINFMEKEH
mgnify:CR=1 FL=1